MDILQAATKKSLERLFNLELNRDNVKKLPY